MNWLQKIAQMGWNPQPYDNDVRDALRHLSLDLNNYENNYENTIELRQLIPMGLIPVDSIPDDLSGWLETEPINEPIPSAEDDVRWYHIVKNLNYETSSRDFSNIADNYRAGTLAPIIIHPDYGVLDGRGRVNFAYALGIPVLTYRLDFEISNQVG